MHLDKSLPAPLGTIGAWLYRAEAALREEVAIQQAHEETANTIHRKLEQHKVDLHAFICTLCFIVSKDVNDPYYTKKDYYFSFLCVVPS